MKVKLNKAVKMFFGNSSLEMIYFEAIANAFDANATIINISISASDLNQIQTLRVKIDDNGDGFTDERFHKFSNLFDVDESAHKGLGRLVYLCYFDKVHITSYFSKNNIREFVFTESFDGESSISLNPEIRPSGSVFNFEGYLLSKLGHYDYVKPQHLKDRILNKFYSRFYKLKQTDKKFIINISLTIGGVKSEERITNEDVPSMEMIPIENTLELFASMELHYLILETPMELSKVITAISVDNRTYNIEIIAPENLPIGYRMVFLLFSDSFNGKVDAARETLSLTDYELQLVKKIFRDNVAKIIDDKVPQISKINKERKDRLVNKFPHLNGYFETENIGFASENDVLKKAQEKFFKAQREILGASKLTEEQYGETIELSSRALTEYILFRQIIINKFKTLDKNDLEADIHKLIIPMKESFQGINTVDDLYRNNVWVLDDKYMTYETILSDEEMTKVVEVITEGEDKIVDTDRPDIALVFSANPTGIKMVDVVIVEFKRKGLSNENNSIVEIQLENRARKLGKYYNQKIQRIWYYGIVEFNEEYILHLESDYNPLFSNGKIYYKQKDVVMQLNPKVIVPAGLYIMDYSAVVNDADNRNSTFLNIIKSKFR